MERDLSVDAVVIVEAASNYAKQIKKGPTVKKQNFNDPKDTTHCLCLDKSLAILYRMICIIEK